MIRTQVYIPEQLYEKAKRQARVQNTSISQFMRDGLQILLKGDRANKNPFDLLVGKFHPGGDVCAAENHNDIYQ